MQFSGSSLSNRPSFAERDIAFHLHPQSNPEAVAASGPNIMTGGKGVRILDAAGRSYLDMHAGLWCTALGLGDERLKDAAMRQFDRLAYAQTFGNRSNEPAIELAEALIRLAPVPMSKVQFQCSGSEANDTAVKIAWFHWRALGQPERRKIIARKKAYHGTTAVAASMTCLVNMNAAFGLPLPGFLHVSCPDIYRGPREGESEADFASRLAQELEDTILREGPETIAAFIAEPVMGAGGLYPPPETYFEKIQAVLKRHDILFIADEVICGFGRTGNWWGSQTFGLEPDILTCAKALSSAYLPISAVMINDRVFEAIKAGAREAGLFGHGYTYGGHPVCAAVACEAIRIYEEDGVVAGVPELADHMKTRLAPLAEHPLVGSIRGVGLMQGVEIVRDKAKREGFDKQYKAGARLQQISLDKGLNIRAVAGHTMAFSPPLIVTKNELDEAVDIFTASLDELAQEMNGVAA